jgi:electron transfer flavoprotein beta subunit
MKILVCISNVPDTTTKIRFTDNNSAFDSAGVQWIINPWDELALTRALELKEAPGSSIEQITVINVGPQSSEPTIRKALAIGADDAVRIDGEASDAYAVASSLSVYLKDNPFDIILCGIDSSDYNGSLVGGMLAEFLEMPSVSSVSKLEIEGGDIKLNREIDGGTEVISTSVPFVAVVQKGIALEPRIPSMRGIMMARKKPLNVIPAAGEASLTDFVSYDLPPAKAACKMVDAENVKELVDLLHNEAKVI